MFFLLNLLLLMATMSCYEYGIYDNVTSIKARIACDNHGELYVNGTLAYSFDSAHGTGVTTEYRDSAYFSPHLDTFALKAWNYGGGYACVLLFNENVLSLEELRNHFKCTHASNWNSDIGSDWLSRDFDDSHWDSITAGSYQYTGEGFNFWAEGVNSESIFCRFHIESLSCPVNSDPDSGGECFCKPGFISETGRGPCDPTCQRGSTLQSGKCLCIPGYSSTTGVSPCKKNPTCQRGSTLQSGKCLCSPGYRSTTGVSPCKPCPDGSGSDIGSTSCQCNSNFYGINGTSPCSPCSLGFTSDPGKSFCVACNGYFPCNSLKSENLSPTSSSQQQRKHMSKKRRNKSHRKHYVYRTHSPTKKP